MSQSENGTGVMSDISEVIKSVPSIRGYLSASPDDKVLLDRLLQAGFGPSALKWLAPTADRKGVLKRFFADLATVDFEWISRLRAEVASRGRITANQRGLEPFPWHGIEGADLTAAGNRELEAGLWGVVIFAGGAATRFWAGASSHPQAAAVLKRFGGSAPKGLFPVGPRTGRSFLDLFAGEMRGSAERTGRQAPLVLMAGRTTRGPLQDWVDESLPEGMDRDLVHVMVQMEHPRLDMDGNLLVRPDGSLVFTGDGHGGVYRAMLENDGDSVASRLAGLGVRRLVLHNVDNVAARALEPSRLGFHALGGYSMTMSAVPRTDPFEKVGIIARDSGTGRVDVVEYSVCPPEVATAVDDSGRLLFMPAHINTNLVDLDAIRADLPRTLYPGKKVEVGDIFVEACSHEMLNQSLAGLLESSRVGVAMLDRSEFFQPTKSLDGADSLESTRRWLSGRGWD